MGSDDVLRGLAQVLVFSTLCSGAALLGNLLDIVKLGESHITGGSVIFITCSFCFWELVRDIFK